MIKHKKEQRLEQTMQDQIEALREALHEGRDRLAIVEGKRDGDALRALGMRRVIELDRPLYAVVEAVEEDEVAILTDLDAAGKRLYGALASRLGERGVRIDNSVRDALFATPVREIEGLTRFLERRGGP